MIRTREQRQADRAWCERMGRHIDPDAQDIADGVIFSIAAGGLFWIVVGLLAGWIS